LADVRYDRIFARWDRCSGLPPRNCLVTAYCVICAIGRDLLDRLGDRRQKLPQHFTITDIAFGRHHRENLARGLIYSQMHFAPGPAFAHAVLAPFPLAFAIDFQSS